MHWQWPGAASRSAWLASVSIGTGGGWLSLRALSPRRRQQIDAAVDAALKTLAPGSELTQVGTS